MRRLYVATSFLDAETVESTIRPAAESHGLTLCSSCTEAGE
jgi:hypothetical protein